ncbi:DNA adenine methylase [Nocardioides marmorisolisilvae]|uniref:site-specific DNA-methyltransferase (adenine-specific) n=1 Tax=Nocardioides marmorisolisilvae TaxID=1542737 RepID=A0A3N0DSY0_9ACTN|nr:DNA adenine methylase [Nocardioides marmorisolisilvae]RNL78734.1 DNA methyltransferase [Nocardioides marmorisolisilvae]
MIKYLGSKRLLVGVLGDIAQAVGASTALDLFTGTTRVAQELKSRGLFVTAADVASYSGVFSDCYIATDADCVDPTEVRAALDELAALPGVRGYVTETFCEASRYFQPHNGMRIDAIRDHIEARYAASPLRPILLTSLLDAADRVDSTTGLQMAYLKAWAPRSYEDLTLREPQLIAGPGRTVVGDAAETARSTPRVDLAYLDPPYNQHRYFTNYHVWETLVRWDAPEHYGIACKRIDARDDVTKSRFNRKREMPQALAELIASVNAETVVVSYNDESWVTPEEMTSWLLDAGHEEVGVLAFDAKRYVGAQIGIFNGAGEKVGEVKKLRNTELVFVAGPKEKVAAATAAPSALAQR